MRATKLLLALVAVTATPVLAQNCFHTAAPGVLLGSAQDVVFPMQPIGFAFPLAGATYTDIHVSDHGLVFLSNGGVPAPPASGSPRLYTPSTATLTIGAPTICALWSDTIGTAPGAVHLDSSPAGCTVTWHNVQSYGLPTPRFSMQMKLLPSGAVEFAWSASATNDSVFGGASQAGLVGITPGGGAPLPAGLDLSAGGATTANTCFQLFPTANGFDMQNVGLLLVPTSPGWIAVPLGSAVCAAARDYGRGCGLAADSIYEPFQTADFDLANRTIKYLRGAAGYTATNGSAGTFVPPGAAATNVAPGQLDGQQTFVLSAPMPVAGGTTTTLRVTTKGQIELGGAALAAIDFTPTVVELLNRPNTHFACWHDFDQTAPGSGPITFEQVAGVAYVTWNGVMSFSGSLPSTFQYQFDLATGDVTLVFGATDGLLETFNPDDILVGYSVGGVSTDPGPQDLSAPFASAVVDVATGADATVTANSLPILGNPGFGFAVANLPDLIPFAVLFYGSAPVDPGLPLGFVGMPGCQAYTTANLGTDAFPVVGGQGFMPVPIPNNPALAGVQVSAQAVAFSPITPLNLIASNGTWITVGN